MTKHNLSKQIFSVMKANTSKKVSFYFSDISLMEKAPQNCNHPTFIK